MESDYCCSVAVFCLGLGIPLLPSSLLVLWLFAGTILLPTVALVAIVRSFYIDCSEHPNERKYHAGSRDPDTCAGSAGIRKALRSFATGI